MSKLVGVRALHMLVHHDSIVYLYLYMYTYTCDTE